MTISWGSLYSRSDDPQTVAAALRESLTALGYQLYDPFGLIPGKAYPQTVRLFVAPAHNNWTRVIGIPDARILPVLSHVGVSLSTLLKANGSADIETYADGKSVAIESALAPFCAVDELARALRGEVPLAIIEEGQKSVFDALSSDAGMQAMAAKVDPKQAQKMFERISGGLMNKVGGDANAAQNLVNAAAPDWNSEGGRRIRAVLACLKLVWNEPDFTALRDAYQLHSRRRRSPNARLYPGDEDAMNLVPDALDYIPVYGGQ
jgi:hypothetical protein